VKIILDMLGRKWYHVFMMGIYSKHGQGSRRKGGSREMIINVKGAYGRGYSHPAEAQRDWNDGKDFAILAVLGGRAGGTYINRGDRDKYAPGAVVNVKTGQGYFRLEDK
jgi:hypothetical protein